MAVRKALFLNAGQPQEVAIADTVAGKRVLTFHSEAPGDGEVALVSYATFPFTVKQVFNLKTSSGTVTASFQIDGVNITSLSGLAVTSSQQSPSASGANSVGIGDRLTLLLASGSTPVNLEFVIDIEV